jgi:hypothetical protein
MESVVRVSKGPLHEGGITMAWKKVEDGTGVEIHREIVETGPFFSPGEDIFARKALIRVEKQVNGKRGSYWEAVENIYGRATAMAVNEDIIGPGYYYMYSAGTRFIAHVSDTEKV